MEYERKITDLNEFLGFLFGFDRLEINRINESSVKMKAIIFSGKTVINFYKIFQSYIDEIEKAKNDPIALSVFKTQLAEHKKVFDHRIEDFRENIISVFKNFEVDFVVSYEGEFKTVYDKITELAI